jgi:hypothetical protein
MNNHFLRVTYQQNLQTGKDRFRFMSFIVSWPCVSLAISQILGINNALYVFVLVVSSVGMGYSMFYIVDSERRNWILFFNNSVSPRTNIKLKTQNNEQRVFPFPRHNSIGYTTTLKGDKVETHSGVLEVSSYHLSLYSRVIMAGMRAYGVDPCQLFPGLSAGRRVIRRDDLKSYWKKLLLPSMTSLISMTSHYVTGIACMIVYVCIIWSAFLFGQLDPNTWDMSVFDVKPMCAWLAFFAVILTPIVAFMSAAVYQIDENRTKHMFTMYKATAIHRLTFLSGYVVAFYCIFNHITSDIA